MATTSPFICIGSQAHRKPWKHEGTGENPAHLLQGLLQPGLFRHRQLAHCVPAIAQLLQLHLHPSGVIPAVLNELPPRALKYLDGARALPQFLLENLPKKERTVQAQLPLLRS